MDRIEKLKEFLKASPTDSFLQHALALEYIKLGNDEEARRLFEELLNREPGYVGSYYHLAKLLERNDHTDEAIT
ncbi:MAG: tetratricopeptide repeat protein, partial [Chitinophagaceae bacterium]